MGKLSGEQVRLEKSWDYQHPKAGLPGPGAGHLASHGKNYNGGWSRLPGDPEACSTSGAYWLPGTLAFSPGPAPLSLRGHGGGSFSHVASSIATKHPLPAPDLVLPPRYTSFCSLAAILPSSESLSCRFLGDTPSPVLLSKPHQGQIPQGSLWTGPD